MEEDDAPESVEDLVKMELQRISQKIGIPKELSDPGSFSVSRDHELMRQVEATSSPYLVNWAAGAPIVDEVSDRFTDHGNGMVSYHISSTVEYAQGCILSFDVRHRRGRVFLKRCVDYADELMDGGFPPPTFSARELDEIARGRDTARTDDVYRRITETLLAYKLQLKNHELKKKIQQQQQLIEHLQARIVDAKEGRRL